MTYRPYAKIVPDDWQESVLDKDLNTPPVSPTNGDRYIIASGGTGDWTGQDDKITEWNGNSWVFTVLSEGQQTWVEDENAYYRYDGAVWAVTTGGGSPWSVSGADVYRLTGGVGIGTAAPQALIHLANDGTNIQAYFEDNNQADASSPYFYFHNDAGIFAIGKANRAAGVPTTPIDIINMNGSGNIAINDVPGSMKFKILSDADEVLRAEHSSATGSPSITLYRNAVSLASFNFSNADDRVNLATTNKNLNLSAGIGSLFMNQTTGNVIVGATTATSDKFAVTGSSGAGSVRSSVINTTNTIDSVAGINLYSGATGSIQLAAIDGILKDITGAAEKGDLRLRVMNAGTITTAMLLKNDTFVGIGENDPLSKLHVTHSSANTDPSTIDNRGTIRLENDNVADNVFSGVLFRGATTAGTNIDAALIAAQYVGKTASQFNTNLSFSLRNISGIKAERMKLYASGCLNVGNALGGDSGTGIVNAKGFYIDGVPIDQSGAWKNPVIDKDLSTPPVSPTTGDRYIVGASGTGAWATHDGEIAQWNGSSWDFEVPVEGDTIYIEDENLYYFHTGSAWAELATAINHQSLIGAGTNTHAQIDTHIADLANPHSVTKAQVGLGNVEDILHNFSATIDPVATDDDVAGYTEGSRWVNTTANTHYVCVDATTSTAIWIQTSGNPAFVAESVPGILPIASGTDAIAIGDGALADAVDTFAAGVGATARTFDATSVGHLCLALEESNLAIGNNCQAGQTAGASNEWGAVAIGAYSVAYEEYCIAIGSATAGKNGTSTDGSAIAIGNSATADELNSIAIGTATLIGGDYSIAIGWTSDANGANGLAVGKRARVFGVSGVSLGDDAETFGANNIAIGTGSTGGTGFPDVTNINTISIGNAANCQGPDAIAFGRDTLSDGTSSLAIVHAADAGGDYAIAIGDTANASTDYSMAFGRNATSLSYAGHMTMTLGTTGIMRTFMLSAATTDATGTVLKGEGETNGLPIASGQVYQFVAYIMASRSSVSSQIATYKYEGCIKNSAGTTSLVGSAIKTIFQEDDATWDVTVTANDTNDTLDFTVTGVAATNITWIAKVELTQLPTV